MCRLKHHNRNLVTRFWLFRCFKFLLALLTENPFHSCYNTSICVPWLELHKGMRLLTLQRTTPSKTRVAELSITLLTWIFFLLSIISIFISLKLEKFRNAHFGVSNGNFFGLSSYAQNMPPTFDKVLNMNHIICHRDAASSKKMGGGQ